MLFAFFFDVSSLTSQLGNRLMETVYITVTCTTTPAPCNLNLWSTVLLIYITEIPTFSHLKLFLY